MPSCSAATTGCCGSRGRTRSFPILSTRPTRSIRWSRSRATGPTPDRTATPTIISNRRPICRGQHVNLSPDHTYRLTRLGKETEGTFTLEPYEYAGGDFFLVVLEQAQMTLILNYDRLESWSEDAVRTQCTQLFERPGAAESGGE